MAADGTNVTGDSPPQQFAVAYLKPSDRHLKSPRSITSNKLNTCSNQHSLRRQSPLERLSNEILHEIRFYSLNIELFFAYRITRERLNSCFVPSKLLDGLSRVITFDRAVDDRTDARR